MESKKFENYEDEISIVDILKVLWKYKWFILIFTIVISILGFGYFYYDDFSSFKYTILINLPSVSYNLFNFIKLYINYDINNNFLKEHFNIKLISINSKDLKQEPYKTTDFPINSLNINIIFDKKPNDTIISNFESYVKDLVFKSSVKDIVSLLEKTLISTNVNIIDPKENYLEFRLFFVEISSNIDNLFRLNKNNIDEDYKVVYDYISELKTTSSYLNYAKKVFLDILSKQFLLINSLDINIENEININEKIKSLIKKEIVVFIAAIFLAVFLVFIIDFFKKNWNEIVK